MMKLKVLAALFALMLGFAAAAMFVAGGATGKIGTTTSPCLNGGSNTPKGGCNGGGLTQPTTVATNPSGQPPPGHNP
jgi:hypothetical protein